MAGKNVNSISQAREYLNKTMGAGTVMSLEGDVTPVPAWSTGSFLIDSITGIGGLPRGRVVELFGAESSGKSTVLASTSAFVQRNDLAVLYADYEHGCDKVYLKAQGVDLSEDKLIYIQPTTMEEGFKIIEYFMSKRLIGLAIVDSLAAMMTAVETTEEIGDVNMRSNLLPARVMAQSLKRLVPACSDSGVTLAFINQLRQSIPTPFEARLGIKRETTPGGSALKFYASMRIKFAKLVGVKGKIFDPITGQWEDGIVATKVRAECVKNKVAAPFRKCEFIIRYGLGVDNVMSIVNVAIIRGVITKKESVFYVPGTYHHSGDESAVRGLDNLCKYYRSEEGKEVYLLLERNIIGLVNKDIEYGAGALAEDVDITEIQEDETHDIGRREAL